MVTLKTIKAFFDNYKFDNNVLILNQSTKITDLKKYVRVNIKMLECNSGKKVYLPYFERLKKIYLKIKQDE
jgi:hypothetical protein